MTGVPDFDKLRAERDAGIEQVVRAVGQKLGADPDEPVTFHSRDYGSPCYCACPDGPCEHAFDGDRSLTDDEDRICGSEQFCSRCGTGALDHSMKLDI